MIPCQKPMDRLIDPNWEAATHVLLIRDVVKLPSKYLCLYWYMIVAPKLGQRSFFFHNGSHVSL